MAAHTERLTIGTQVLAKARGINAKAARDQVEAVKEIGYTTENATEIINRMLVAGQHLQRSQALAKAAKDLYAIGLGSSPAETVEKMLLAVETGAKFGGPIGGVIGGAIGFGAGLIRLFFKNATEKTREKVRAAYGVDVKDKAVLQQIVDTAKQTFAGNIDMAIRSAAVQETIQLHAMATGQTVKGMPGKVAPVTLGQTGGALYQIPGYSNGSPLSSPGGLLPSMGLDRITAVLASTAGPMVIRLDGPATTALLRGEAVQAIVDNPRTVQAATLAATKANAGRRQMTALQVSPGTITS